MKSEIRSCHLKGAACTRAGLFKDQRNALSVRDLVADALFPFILEPCGKVEEISDLLRCIIKQL